MKIETTEDFKGARRRLQRRDPESLAVFVMSLAMDPGPVGEQVRTFIVGDDLAETVESLKGRIGRLGTPSEYEHRHSRGREVGTSLDFIIDSVERLVLPVDANAAFELLAAIFEADAVAIENCGEYGWEVTCAYQRAVGVMATAARNIPPARVEEQVKTLLEGDTYGMRVELAAAFPENRNEHH